MLKYIRRLGSYGNSLFGLGLLLCLGQGVITRADNDPKLYAVMVSAQVQSSPAQITLQWPADGNATGYSISRKENGNWNAVANVAGGATSWTDSNVSNGGAYEYRIIKSTSAGYKGTGYIYAGVNAALKEQRGKVVLMVDNTFSTSLAAELKRLEWDLAGDGWTVLRHDVSRNDSVVSVKNIIRNDYYSDPSNVKAVFLFGHIAVPYSGNFNPDGHPDHQGAWPADLYYGDMDGNWTDGSAYSSGATRPANQNRPGDGKFDQSEMPSAVEIAVGRVDLYNMTCYANKTPARSELDLMRNYLNKDHNFRHRVFNVERRGLICDNWGERSGEAFAASGWRSFAPMFGANNISQVGGWQYFPTIGSQGYLWSHAGGGGSWYTCDGVGGADNFATTEIKGVFTMFIGSYFGDWDNESNFMRAALGSGNCLTTSWAGRPHWFYHHMGLGEHIGYSAMVSQNNGFGLGYEAQNYGTRGVHVALLGDPTLRLHPVVPVSNLNGSANGGSMSLSWNGSTDSDIAGYHVYRGSGPNGSFSRITSSPINATSFTDNGYSAGVTYMVRAIKLERSGSGTYYNGSQGIFFPANGSTSGGGGTGIPQTPPPNSASMLAVTTSTASQISIAWRDNSSDETGFRIERKTGVSGSWTQVGTVGANITSFSSGGLSPATVYYFRVFAYNASAASAPSNEANASTAVANSTPAGAAFAGLNAGTKGSWKTVFGEEGHQIMAAGSSIPGYATVQAGGKEDYQWSDSSSDLRALEKPAGSQRVAACWFSPSSFTVDVNLFDGASHKLSLFFLDWDRSGRSQEVEILDAVTGGVLDTRTISDFQEGVYASWNVKGAVRVRITKLAGANAILNGLFFDAASPAGESASKVEMVNGKIQLEIKGQAGQKFDIYITENFGVWTKLTTVTLTGPVYNFSDTTSTGKALRFYRAVAVP